MRRWTSQLIESSFGPSPESKESVILEPFFLLKFHGGLSWDEQYHMPVAYKHWYLKRLERELAKEGVSQDTARGTQTPQRAINLRQLQTVFSQPKNNND